MEKKFKDEKLSLLETALAMERKSPSAEILKKLHQVQNLNLEISLLLFAKVVTHHLLVLNSFEIVDPKSEFILNENLEECCYVFKFRPEFLFEVTYIRKKKNVTVMMQRTINDMEPISACYSIQSRVLPNLKAHSEAEVRSTCVDALNEMLEKFSNLWLNFD